MNGCSGFSSIASHDHDRSPPTLGSTDKWTGTMNYKWTEAMNYKWTETMNYKLSDVFLQVICGHWNWKNKIRSLWKIDLILTAKKEWLSNFHFSKKKCLRLTVWGMITLSKKHFVKNNFFKNQMLNKKSKTNHKISGWSLCQHFLTSTSTNLKTYPGCFSPIWLG